MNRNFVLAAAALAFAAPPIIAEAQVQAQRFDVLFPFDSAELTPAARGVVAEAAAAYRTAGRAQIFLLGTTDTVGSQDYNLDLSRRRAQAVQEALVSLGVPAGEIDANWTGETNIPVPTEDGVRLAANRSVQIAVAQPASPPPPAPAPEPEPEAVGFRFAIAPYVGAHLDGFSDGGHDDSVFVGGNLTASYELTPMLVAEAEQAIFWNLLSDDNGLGGRSAAGLNVQVPPDLLPTAIGPVLPYVGANVGAIYGQDAIDNEWFAGPEVGLRVGPLAAKLAYDIPFHDDPWDEGVISATLGLGWRF